MKSLLIGFCALALTAAAALAGEHDHIVLWPHGAPGVHKATPETRRIFPPDEEIVSNIHVPVIIPYLPDPAKATGAAAIVVPGGGDVEIWMTHEGYRVAQFLADHGVAAFIVKYRLSKAPGSTYTITGDSLPDVQRAIETVKARSVEWHIDPARVGIIGFSAGGELAALAGTHFAPGAPNALDTVLRESSRPAFMGLVYGMAADMPLSPDTPPAFLLGGEKDDYSKNLPGLYLAMEKAGVSAEIHMLAGVGHGFGIRPTNPPHVAVWPDLFVNWLDAIGMLKAK